MVQVKIYGLEEKLVPIKQDLSDIIHSCIVDIFKIPKQKKFQRFFPLKEKNYIFPLDRSNNYLIIEIIMFKGRSIETKKTLISTLYKRITEELVISLQDIEIIMLESSKENWGIRGFSGDELTLNYKTNI